jgi:CRISPR/Cas system endoribonuclease Cas6 (RAMP superfamily)
VHKYWLCHTCFCQLRAWLVSCQAHRESAFAISISSTIESDLLSVIQVPPAVMAHSIANIEKTRTKYFALLMVSTSGACKAINPGPTGSFPLRSCPSENVYDRLWYTGSKNPEEVVQALQISISHPDPCKSNQLRLGSELSTNSPVQLYLSGLPSFEWTAMNLEQSSHKAPHTHTQSGVLSPVP